MIAWLTFKTMTNLCKLQPSLLFCIYDNTYIITCTEEVSYSFLDFQVSHFV